MGEGLTGGSSLSKLVAFLIAVMLPAWASGAECDFHGQTVATVAMASVFAVVASGRDWRGP